MEVDSDTTRTRVYFSRKKRAEDGFFTVGLDRIQPEQGSVLLLGLPRGNVTRARLRAIDSFFKQPEGSTKKERLPTHRTQVILYRILMTVEVITDEVRKACLERFFRLSEKNSPISVEFFGTPFSKPLPIDLLNCPNGVLEPPALLLILQESGFVPKTVETWPKVSLARIQFYEQRHADHFLSQLEVAPTLEGIRALLRGGAKLSHRFGTTESARFHLTPSMSFEDLWKSFETRPDLMISDYYRPVAEKDKERFCFFTVHGGWKPDEGFLGPSRILSSAGRRDTTTSHELSAHQRQISVLQEKLEALTKRVEEISNNPSRDEVRAIVAGQFEAVSPMVKLTVAEQIGQLVRPLLDERNQELTRDLTRDLTARIDESFDRFAKALGIGAGTGAASTSTPPRPQKKNKSQHQNQSEGRQLTLTFPGTTQQRAT